MPLVVKPSFRKVADAGRSPLLSDGA
jgi:hypothetical protein